ncbi:putative biotin carboxyl carrier protein (plasmid) [Natrialba magadii ATCC 43099]|uniref:Biotin carboxyl carrier protein of acetyl-CoA carboxylase n=1 Tax=Natrialba magadii (strain ATCC 43099 / DSM 3394 / CCM 3739 / CIP 104546 / IAM 13178 / JCM 8861 / NBRC 102185 / NCIMB 2190 / MS3) TaxID=547559 RepID=D3T1W0_NATMM|nr:acetyl-CoA carboxylase [Natrialba magadii]ADD07569.1 putative biotin carboxyl carrier protein [Natrialba magadii ATCC 43099]ELY27209.1 biotin/lipoyl attachment domain-containing protein [Natrialba magadii ATCC 43099]
MTETINSPMPGVFYRQPDPDDPPFVEPGDEVEPGDTIGLVEVMKNFNEITAESSGTVSEFLVENEAEIEADQPLVELE